MKKLLGSFCAATLLISITANVISCSKQTPSPYTDGDYFDSELAKVPANIRNYVQYTSLIAKILIASRHENMNTYAFPQLTYFLNDIAQNSDGLFRTKSGKMVNIGKYIRGYKNLNQLDFNPWQFDYSSQVIPKNTYNIMNSIARPDDMSKYYNISANELVNNEAKLKEETWVNPNMGWVQYDTGAYANTLVRRSQNIINYMEKSHSNYFVSSSKPYVSDLLYDNIGLDGVSDDTLSFKDVNSGGQKVTYGRAITDISNAQYKQYSLQYFNLALQLLSSFQAGLEFQVLSALTLLIPIVPNTNGASHTFGVLLSLPFILLMGDYNNWFDNNKVKKDSIIGKYFSQQTYDTTTISYVLDGKQKTNQKLRDIISDGTNIAFNTIINNTSLYLNVTDHPNDLLKLTAALGDWLRIAMEKEEKAGHIINLDQFDHDMNAEISIMMTKAMQLISMVPSLSSQATSLMWIMMQMFRSGKIDTYNLLRGLSGFAHWIYERTPTDYVPTKHAEEVNDVFTKTSGMQGFSESISDVDRNSEYGQYVLHKYGSGEGVGFEKGSFFEMINQWSVGDADKNSDNYAMYTFIQNLLNPNSKYSYISGILQEIQQAMANDWFDNIFLDKRWYIKATGTGPGGEQLGAIDIDTAKGRVKKIRYQLDYYGPKDASTDLGHHRKPLNYLGTINDTYYNGEKVPSDRSKWYNKPPLDGDKEENWDSYSWAQYDGDGEEYLENSEEIKYSYVVEFTDELSYFKFYVGDKMSFKMTDFKWYYDGERYY